MPQRFDRIQAQVIELVDAAGQVRARLGVDVDGATLIEVRGPHAFPQLTIRADEAMLTVIGEDHEGKSRAAMYSGRTGSAFAVLSDRPAEKPAGAALIAHTAPEEAPVLRFMGRGGESMEVAIKGRTVRGEPSADQGAMPWEVFGRDVGFS